MNKYDKMIEKEKVLWEDDIKKHNDQIKELANKIHSACYGYNQEIATINSERSGLKEIIDNLYYFLREFGRIGEKVKPFEFNNEAWLVFDINSITESEIADLPEQKEKNKTSKKVIDVLAPIAVGTVIAVMPITLPIYSLLIPVGVSSIFSGIKKGASDKDYKNFLKKHNDAIDEYKNKENTLEAFYKKINLFIEIAKLYYGVIAMVKETIRYTIYPELPGIKAFLYAQALTDKIVEETIIDSDTKPVDILELYETKYNTHYLFMKNTIDYYTLTATIFKEPILTNLTNLENENKYFENIKINFEKQSEEIKEKKHCLSKHAVFTRRG